jgi:hypothetical protein
MWVGPKRKRLGPFFDDTLVINVPVELVFGGSQYTCHGQINQGFPPTPNPVATPPC